MRIVVDAMGSDGHPGPDVAGGVAAAREFGGEIILVGDESAIRRELAGLETAGLALHIQPAGQVITMEDKPSEAARNKPDSSMHVGLNLVRDGAADAFVSAGNTGGVLAVAMLHSLRRIPGVRRPALAVNFPIPGHPLLIDNGANTDCKPEWLLQFAIMGSLYVQRTRGVERPRIALISNGEEEGKGTELIKESIPLLANSGLHYIGNIEPKEFMAGMTDVGVTDGFTGNIIVKTGEAVASQISQLLRTAIRSHPLSAVGGLLARPAFNQVRRQLDPYEVGGAPLLGVNGAVVIAHGRSNAHAIKQAVRQARSLVEQDVVAAIRDGLSRGGVPNASIRDVKG